MKSIILKTIFIVACVLISKTSLAESTKATARQLSILFPDNGVRPYSPKATGYTQQTFFNAVLGSLLNVSENYDLQPGLISKFYWDFKESCYILELRKDLKFHNGRPVDAYDLEFSLIRPLIQKEQSWEKTLFENVVGVRELTHPVNYRSGIVKGIQVVDSHRVKVRLKSPNPSFLFSLTRSGVSLVPKEELKEDYVTWKKFPVGAGLFRVVDENVDGSKVTVESVKTLSDQERARRIIFMTKGNVQEADLLFGFVKNPEPEIFATEYNKTGLPKTTNFEIFFSNRFGT